MNMKNMKMKTVIIDNMGSSHWSDSKKSDKHSSDCHRQEYMCAYIISRLYHFEKNAQIYIPC